LTPIGVDGGPRRVMSSTSMTRKQRLSINKLLCDIFNDESTATYNYDHTRHSRHVYDGYSGITTKPLLPLIESMTNVAAEVAIKCVVSPSNRYSRGKLC
jgi:hypothetical protein